MVSSEGQSDAVVEGQPVEVDDEAMEDETKEGEDEKPTAPLVIKKKKEKKPEKKDSCYMWCCKKCVLLPWVSRDMCLLPMVSIYVLPPMRPSPD